MAVLVWTTVGLPVGCLGATVGIFVGLEEGRDDGCDEGEALAATMGGAITGSLVGATIGASVISKNGSSTRSNVIDELPNSWRRRPMAVAVTVFGPSLISEQE